MMLQYQTNSSDPIRSDPSISPPALWERAMDVGNGWIGRGCPRADQDPTILNRILLKFRPIAPKPAAAGSGSGSAPEESKTGDVSKRRSKRKYVRVKKKVRCRKNNNNNSDEKEEEGRCSKKVDTSSLLTLQLLPESSNSSSALESPKKGCYENFSSGEERPCSLWINNNNNNNIIGWRVVESWVMVDGMSKTWVDRGALGDTDMEKMKNLEVDTCPGMISDGLDRVQWVNLAYRRMVDPVTPPVEVVARLVVKDKIRTALGGDEGAFACTVRVMYTRHTGKHTQTMPCDVWKMEFGGFAWRFDAKAALCLGR